MSKLYESAEMALEGLLFDGMSIASGGFGICGIPEKLTLALRDSGVMNITVVSNNCGSADFGLKLLLETHQIKKMISSYVGDNPLFEKQYLDGDLELELTPQGTLAEKLRAGGAGIPAFYTKTAYGTQLAKGKPLATFGNNEYVLEESITVDLGIVKAQKADKAGNLIFNKTARNFNPLCAKAARFTVAEVEEIVEVGEIDPDDVHLPGIYIDRLILGVDYIKPIEIKMIAGSGAGFKVTEQREWIAKRIAQELKNGDYVNLGIGIPTLVANYVSTELNITLQSENGLLGMGPFPAERDLDPDLINAGKQTVSANLGASFFDSAESFGMVRGKHVDMSVLGAMQVSKFGDIANWVIPGTMIKGPGGAMDLVYGAQNLIVAMEHVAKGNKHKILDECSLPLTGMKCVNMIVSELAVFTVNQQEGLTLVELSPFAESVEEIREKTGCDFKVALK